MRRVDRKLDRLDSYLDLWSQAESMTNGYTETGARRLDLDVNVKVPQPCHFGPPPAGWGMDLAGLHGLGELDPTRRPAVPCGGKTAFHYDMASPKDVSTRWVQTKLRDSGAAITVDGVFGPRTLSALMFFANPSGQRVSGPGDLERSMRFEVCSSTRIVVASGLELALSTVPPRPSPGGGPEVTVGPVTFEDEPTTTASSGVGAILPLAFLGFGLAYLFRGR